MFSIDVKSREPIYFQLEKNIVKSINLGILNKDDKLPSIRNFAVELGVNPNTVSKAYKSLEEKGIIYTVQGKGAFVSGDEKGIETIKHAAEKKLKIAIKNAKNLGVSKEKMIEIVNSVITDEGVKK